MVERLVVCDRPYRRRSAILLIGGDKSGDWSGWYYRAISCAEELYAEYLAEREAEEKDQ
ncbi:hypothetical protein [Nonomuraea guangzhouensis]|uniref:Uncharacterized protein n=1 Tax=Nonomuraea guangzhouensis TaxID=1291555 RepID=A0ABW4GK49_9ACTN|nr:hypothetical protein [Nonomuraea guangzhouensis]